MTAPTMQPMGLGASGYMRIQKESVYNTGVTNSMKDVKILPDSNIMVNNETIETLNQVGSRIKQDPNLLGRIKIGGKIVSDIDPTLLGYLMDLALDQAAVSGDANAGYVHTYLAPYTGDGVTNSFTIQQAQGAALADQFNGNTIVGFELSSDNQKNQKMVLDTIGCSHTADVARQSSFSFGAVQPFSFGQTVLTLIFNGYTVYTQKVNSYNFKVDLGYNTENFKLGSRNIDQPNFKQIVTAQLKLNCDADATLQEFARNQTSFSALLTTTHAVKAGAVSGYYGFALELPKLLLKPDTEIKNSNERLTMDLEGTIYGGTTTGSGANVVPFEVRVTDATSTYA